MGIHVLCKGESRGNRVGRDLGTCQRVGFGRAASIRSFLWIPGWGLVGFLPEALEKVNNMQKNKACMAFDGDR
jgi:hypothetical protein